MSKDTSKNKSNDNKELSARLLAVQACYQIAHNAKSVREVAQESLEHGVHMDIDGQQLPKPHSALFKKILFSLNDRLADINDIVESNVNKKDVIIAIAPEVDALESDKENSEEKETPLPPLEKEIEPLLKSIMLCGVTELLSHQEIDTAIIIDDYLNITHAFYEKNQVSFVNAVLDKVASNLRA